MKNEDIDIRGYETMPELHRCLSRHFTFSKGERLYQSLEYRRAAAVYRR